MREIEVLREMLDRADERARSAVADAVKPLVDDRDELVRQLAEANTILKLYESGRLKPPGA